jgi:hypothetical protein
MAPRTQRPTRSKYKPRTVVPALAALLLFFIPALALIPFWLLVDGFIPSVELRHTAGLFAAFTGIAFLALLWRTQIQEVKNHWASSRKRQSLQSVAFFAFVPLFGVAIGYGFVHGPVNYSLHYMSAPTEGNVNARVISADDFGGRRCRNRALLENNRLLWHRQVCGISDDAVERLRRGGYIQLEGTTSQYGMHVQRYAVVTANPSIERTSPGKPGAASHVKR